MLLRVVSSLVIALALFLPQFTRASAAPAFSHIYVIMEENTSYDAIVGNMADAPYINSLINTYGFAANYYGVTHPSEPNYIASIAGDFFGLHADDPAFRSDATNLVDQLESKGLTWATYQQGLPAVGSTVDQYPATGTGLYVKKHDPFMLFNDITSNPNRLKNIKPMDDLATDLATGTAPNYSFIVPDECHDMHGVSPPSAAAYGMPWCGYPPNFVIPHATVQAADSYLKYLVTTIMSSPAWTSDSVIVVTWDENESSGLPSSGPTRGYAGKEGCCGSPPNDGGGRVPTIVITNTPTHLVSLNAYNHYSLMKTIENNWDLGCLLHTCDGSVQPMTDLTQPMANNTPLSVASGFAVTFYSKVPGQGMIYFGPSCNALVEVATRDVTPNSTTHTVFVSGNDLPGTVGDIGITPGTQYFYEAVTIPRNGVPEIDNNNGNCYTYYTTKP
jgi:hypothetical protein